MKKIPYGISNFKKLINENYYYVDKTRYIEMIENFNEQYIIFLRPRRFGKSLFISLLAYYYDKLWKEEKLFEGLYIGKHPTKLKSSYNILRFSFSGINTDSENDTIKGFNNSVKNGIVYFVKRYNLNVSIDYSLSAADILSSLFTEVF